MKLLGLCGEIGAGKDTVADILANRHSFHVLSFKSRMIEFLCHLFGVERDLFESRTLKELPDKRLFGRTPREVMRSFGTDWGRNMIHSDIWVDRVERILRADTFPRVVVTDVRFENEAEMIMKYGGMLALIERKDNPFRQITAHISDLPLKSDLIDCYIVNNGSIDELEDLVDTVVREL